MAGNGRHPSHSKLIHALGGPKKVAEFLRETVGEGPTPQGVSQWCRRGVAWRFRSPVARFAAEQGVPLPRGFLDARRAA